MKSLSSKSPKFPKLVMKSLGFSEMGNNPFTGVGTADVP